MSLCYNLLLPKISIEKPRYLLDNRVKDMYLHRQSVIYNIDTELNWNY